MIHIVSFCCRFENVKCCHQMFTSQACGLLKASLDCLPHFEEHGSQWTGLRFTSSNMTLVLWLLYGDKAIVQLLQASRFTTRQQGQLVTRSKSFPFQQLINVKTFCNNFCEPLTVNSFRSVIHQTLFSRSLLHDISTFLWQSLLLQGLFYLFFIFLLLVQDH